MCVCRLMKTIENGIEKYLIIKEEAWLSPFFVTTFFYSLDILSLSDDRSEGFLYFWDDY